MDIVALNSLIAVAENVLKQFLILPGNPKPERTGGYLAVMETRPQKKIVTITELGTCPPNMLKAFNICQEKLHRLHHYLGKGHISSWQSRNIKNKKYGGGIITPSDSDWIGNGNGLMGSFSGLVEHGDEAVVLVTWAIMGWIDYNEAQKIIKISENPFFSPLLSAVSSKKQSMM